MKVSKVGVAEVESTCMAACSSGSVISGRSIRLSIGRPSRILPDRLVFGLDLLLGRVCRDVDAEQAQACERTGHSLWVFRLHSMEPTFRW